MEEADESSGSRSGDGQARMAASGLKLAVAERKEEGVVGVGGGDSRGGGPAGGSNDTGRVDRRFLAFRAPSLDERLGEVATLVAILCVSSGATEGSRSIMSGRNIWSTKEGEKRGDKKERSLRVEPIESGLRGERGLTAEEMDPRNEVKDMSGSSGDWEPRRGVKLGGMGKLKRVFSASSLAEREKMDTRSTASVFGLVTGLVTSLSAGTLVVFSAGAAGEAAVGASSSMISLVIESERPNSSCRRMTRDAGGVQMGFEPAVVGPPTRVAYALLDMGGKLAGEIGLITLDWFECLLLLRVKSQKRPVLPPVLIGV